MNEQNVQPENSAAGFPLETVVMPIFECAYTFAHGSWTHEELAAESIDVLKNVIEKRCNTDEEPEYRFGEWLLIREKIAFPPFEEIVENILLRA